MANGPVSATFLPSASLKTPSKELVSIQYLRAIAAIAVIFFHAAKMMHRSFEAGAAGVDVFFVISGFIMWTIGARYGAKPGAFLAKRAARIVPLYWVLTLVVAAIALLPPAFRSYGAIPSVGHLVASLLFVPEHSAPVIPAGWTLDFEVLFYLVFALSLFLAARARLIALTLALAGLSFAGWLTHPANPVLTMLTSPLLLEFAGGVWLGKAWSDGLRLPAWLGAPLLAIGFGAIVLVPMLGIYPEANRTLLWGVPAILIVAGALSLEPVRAWQPLKFLGDASYAIYLAHVTALAYAGMLLGPLQLPFAIGCAVSVALAVSAGCLCHVFIERPLLERFHGGTNGRAGERPSPRPRSALVRVAEGADPA